MTGAFDPQLGLVYWGVGNPHPPHRGEARGGDNLYSDSVVALDAQTGRLRWYFQFTPHDLYDWDSAQTPVLVDAVVAGAPRRLLALANRNGFYYLLDRVSGEFLLGVPFVRQTWADGLDARGRPRVRAESIPTRAGALVYPSVTGATNWWASSYDPLQALMYVPTIERGSFFFASADQVLRPDGQSLGSDTSAVPGERLVTSVKALEVTTGRLRWHYDGSPRLGQGRMGGLLSTAGGMVFGSDLEVFFALDAATGTELWRFQAGAQILAAPISYQLAGRQYVAIAAGRSVLAFALAPGESHRDPGR
jgi:alcohol dehydrogenase (cytochrome c)